MILLAVVCVMLYVLGGMLAYSVVQADMAPDTESRKAARFVAVIGWPWLAFHLALDTDDDGDVSQRGK